MKTPNNKDNQIIQVEPKPIEPPKTPITKTGGLQIGNVQTLNLIIEPLKKRYHTHYKKDKVHLIVDLILGAIILVLIGVMLNLWFFSRSQKNLMDFQVSSNPESLINGQETEFTLDYTNTSKDELSEVTLVLKLPDSLREPQYNLSEFDTKTATLNIGTLASKTSGQFTVKGLLLGNFQDKHEFIAAINYKNQYGLERQEFFSQHFTLTDSVLKTELKFPQKVIANGIFTTDFNINNISTFDFETVKVKIVGSNNFSLRQINLDKIGANTYLIGELKPGQTFDHDFSAKILGANESTATITTEIIATYNKKEYVLNKIDNTITTGVSNLKLGFLNLEENRNIAPGGTTTYTLYYKNNENYTLNNVELGLALYGDYADTAYLSNHYKNVQGNIAMLNQNQYPQLAKIEPGQEGEIQFKAAARSNVVFNKEQITGYQLEATVVAGYDDPQLQTRVTLESEPIYTQLDSNLILKTTALFYTASGDQIGVGSVPPVVGEYTSYWAIIKVNNTNNKIKDITISAKVPVEVDYTYINNVTAGNHINFDENSRTITWQINTINAFAGIFNASPEARIQLAIIPTEDQVGKSPLLLTDIKATATDEVTNAFVSAGGTNISTAIFSDATKNKVTQ